ncbi:hypothetical protein ASPZODRAFT_1237540 [Penicilliopsis zonata CBS 506.65]|uniref:Uncharacterized protein n=1 Tax=Penicilliopsis zonata CBS 506.65 TaxID=1073090 RepID=A0A1L9S6X9_9EURO|nr:hypothetical protein ASPZODRAFT_1237540 [Penicilliopsis zonata CBS 506.65]OJJ42916.1 hypothetical protein ASPZODRAFT_1237540 [Penicilliopsis zonata CBS 506.65]
MGFSGDIPGSAAAAAAGRTCSTTSHQVFLPLLPLLLSLPLLFFSPTPSGCLMLVSSRTYTFLKPSRVSSFLLLLPSTCLLSLSLSLSLPISPLLLLLLFSLTSIRLAAMARLCLPGLTQVPGSKAARFKTQPAFRCLPRTVVFRANRESLSSRIPSPPPTPSPPSPASPAGGRSFTEMSRGSRLPIRKVVPPTPCTVSPLRSAPTASSTSPSLEARRAARQARQRPWSQPVKTTPRQEGSSCSAAARTPRSVVVRPPPVQPVAVPGASARKAIALIDAALAKPRPRRAQETTPVVSDKKKRVRFGDATVHHVDPWIVRSEHVFPAPGRILGLLVGWKVTPLAIPDEYGETEKYSTSWASDSASMYADHVHGPKYCDPDCCAWASLAQVARANPTCNLRQVKKIWLAMRWKARRMGHFFL